VAAVVIPGNRPSASSLGWVLPARWAGVVPAGRRRDEGPAPGIERVFLLLGGQCAPGARGIALHVATE